MRNPEDEDASYPNSMIKSFVFLILLLFSLSSFGSIYAVDSEAQEQVKWEILTKLNFSSQIRTHPHILLLITVPWSGESRSLMRDLSQVVNYKQQKFGTLKLMIVHRNSDKMLAEALGATEGINLLYYHQSLSYKYQGPLRVQNILSSVYHLMSLPPDDIPLKSLTTPEDLKSFIESTDKALIVMEFCGWTSRLLTKAKNSVADNGFGGILGSGFNLANGTFASGGKNMQKMESEQMNCGSNSGNIWTGEFSTKNMSDFPRSLPTDGVSCSFEAFQKYETFLTELMIIAKEFFLPPERIRFGLVQERALLSFLGVKDSGPWLAMLHFAGCPSCSKILGEGDDIRHAIQMQALPVTELEGDGNGPDPAIPANKPSILLFIDRSSESLEVRKKSKEALDAFRELAMYHRMSEGTTAKSQKSSTGTYQSSRSTVGHPQFDMSPVSQKTTEPKDKMSVVLMDKGKHITINKAASNLQGRSLQEILTYLLQHKKEIKISSLAKNAGFELLSDDFTVKVAEELPAELKVQSNEVSAELRGEDSQGSDSGHLSQNQTPHMAGGRDEELDNSADAEQKDVKEILVDSSKLLSAGSGSRYSVDQVAYTAYMEHEKILPDVGHNFPGYVGSFCFSDGRFRLVKALDPSSTIPMVVIIDPLSQQHYMFPEEEVVRYSSLSDFLERFLNGSLVPFQRAESSTRAPRESPRPPFVNLNFHAVDSVPRLTTNTFLELVVGNQSDLANASNAWKKDVLVLFSNTWCGFCQRMELVVRELHSAFKGYVRMLKDKSSLTTDDVENTILKLPLIYLMDCTLNDCSLILKSALQRDLYPSLLLFPAERKKAVPYGGDMAVSEIIDFIADHGSNSERLFGENGILWSKASQRVRYENLHKDVPQAVIIKEPSPSNIYHEVLLKDSAQRIEVRDHETNPRRYDGPHTVTELFAGSILVATDKLLNVHPFDGSKILIVKVNQSTGFQGVIINKHISWDSLGKLDEGSELLKKAPLSLGGPVIIREMPLVALTRKLVTYRDQGAEPDIHFLDQWETLDVMKALRAGDHSISDYWFFMGYSSWEWNQLFDEIAEGSWKISNGGMEQLDWPQSD